MNIQVLQKNNFQIKFLLEGVKPSFASALRRVMMTEIPTMAIEWVDFKKNDSALNDEIIANRLGQMPLTFDQNAYNVTGECKCGGKGCSNCQVKLALKKKGPAMVYSGDLKSDAKDVKPVYDKIPITELFDGQEIQLEATAQLGFGKVHTKWQGAIVGYQADPIIIDKVVKPCPVHKFIAVNGGYVVDRYDDCELCGESVDEVKRKNKVNVLKDAFVFNVESVSGLSAEDVVLTAADVLEKKFEEFGKNLKKLK